MYLFACVSYGFRDTARSGRESHQIAILIVIVSGAYGDDDGDGGGRYRHDV